MALANILRTDAEMHRPLPADSELVQAIAVLARAQQDAVWNPVFELGQLRASRLDMFMIMARWTMASWCAGRVS
jgi:hypothetical protein